MHHVATSLEIDVAAIDGHRTDVQIAVGTMLVSLLHHVCILVASHAPSIDPEPGHVPWTTTNTNVARLPSTTPRRRYSNSSVWLKHLRLISPRFGKRVPMEGSATQSLEAEQTAADIT